MMKLESYAFHDITIFIVHVIFLALLVDCNIFSQIYPRLEVLTKCDENNAGEPLMVTPFLRNGSISLARKLSAVSATNVIGIPSHAGFFTVNETYNSNLYFWYFPPQSGKEDAPVLLWLQGGPGGSSLFGLFYELGPIIAAKKGFIPRKYNWAVNYHLIFIDNPVGTGFSFADIKGYCSDEDCIATNLFKGMDQFFDLFPNLRKNEFYLTGESYAGKYIPAFGMEIYRQNQIKFRINLKGMAIGNGYIDPVHQLDYASYLYQHGLVDYDQMTVLMELQQRIVNAVNKNDYFIADVLMDLLIGGDNSLFYNYTGIKDVYNYVKPMDDADLVLLTNLLSNCSIRKSVHVGNLEFHSGKEVGIMLSLDVMKTAAPYLSELLSHYRVMLYNGQLDVIVAYPLTDNFVRQLEFSGKDDFKKASRKIWKVNGDVAGYYKTGGNLTEVLVRNAGHLVPHDQPRWAFDLITRFVNKKL